MSATPFQPAPFSVPIVNPNASTLFRRTPYISPSEYNAAPTAVATNQLVPSGNAQQNLNELANVIMRASGWADLICFHRADGTLAASPSTEAGWITPKGTMLAIQANFRPILEVDGLALGASPQNLNNIGDTAAQSLSIEGNIIYLTVPSGGVVPFSPTALTFPSATFAGKVYAAWSYVSGFPHTYLAENAAEGDMSIVVGPSIPGGSVVYGVYDGTTQLTIHDSVGGTEVVVVESMEGLTLNLQSPLQYSHTVPTEPDTIRVTAIPWGIEQAVISLVSCLIKLRGTRALSLPTAPGGGAGKQQLIQAGGLEDYEVAIDFLKPFTTVYLRNSSA